MCSALQRSSVCGAADCPEGYILKANPSLKPAGDAAAIQSACCVSIITTSILAAAVVACTCWQSSVTPLSILQVAGTACSKAGPSGGAFECSRTQTAIVNVTIPSGTTGWTNQAAICCSVRGKLWRVQLDMRAPQVDQHTALKAPPLAACITSGHQSRGCPLQHMLPSAAATTTQSTESVPSAIMTCCCRVQRQRHVPMHRLQTRPARSLAQQGLSRWQMLPVFLLLRHWTQMTRLLPSAV